MTILLPKNKTYFQKTKRIEIRFVFWLSERSKLAITFKRFELEPRIRYHSKALTETHLSGKFQPDRSSLKIFGFYEKKTYCKKKRNRDTFSFSVVWQVQVSLLASFRSNLLTGSSN